MQKKMQFFIKGLNHYNDSFEYNTEFFCIMTFFDILLAIILPPTLYIVYSMLIMCYTGICYGNMLIVLRKRTYAIYSVVMMWVLKYISWALLDHIMSHVSSLSEVNKHMNIPPTNAQIPLCTAILCRNLYLS